MNKIEILEILEKTDDSTEFDLSINVVNLCDYKGDFSGNKKEFTIKFIEFKMK
jgi:hypothetical protein